MGEEEGGCLREEGEHHSLVQRGVVRGCLSCGGRRLSLGLVGVAHHGHEVVGGGGSSPGVHRGGLGASEGAAARAQRSSTGDEAEGHPTQGMRSEVIQQTG